ncbi:MAG: hypothetical protein SGILL_004886 [Bacillariaceae sp.]
MATTTFGFVALAPHQESERIQQCCTTHTLCKASSRVSSPLFAITKRISLEEQRWFPTAYLDDGDDVERRSLEQASVDLVASIIRPIIYPSLPLDDDDDDETRQDTDVRDSESETRQAPNNNVDQDDDDNNSAAYELAKGRFLDLCCNVKGEETLERFFQHPLAQEAAAKDLRVVRGAIVCLQRLLVLGMSYGVTMNVEVLARSVNHMKEEDDEMESQKDPFEWTSESSRRLKYQASGNDSVKAPGIQLLAALKRRQASIGAYELLVDLGVWDKHENLALLRSGVPLRFTDKEHQIALDAAKSTRDPDEELGIRQDLRTQKVFTIDSASTSEIDDGLGVEVIDGDDSDKPRYRYWVHIADADRWAPRDSTLLQVARKRATSIYLPNGAISMMPKDISSDVMSLRANTDSEALSLGVELAEDGSIIDDSIVLCPSTVRVTYRLTYDQVDEMIEDGIAFNEEWELGKLLTAAQTRRIFRRNNGSSEKFVPNPLPQYTLSVAPDSKAPDGHGIKVDIQVGNNSGKNMSSVDANENTAGNTSLAEELPASASNTLVTEMMILAGEAIGKWARREAMSAELEGQSNPLKLPFRSQPKPDYRSRSREKKIMMDLLEYNVGDGYCHAWYARRFMSPVKVSSFFNPHSGLGLECYVQWTSPIRRFQDLQVHTVVKRYLRRQKVLEKLNDGQLLPESITSTDLGCDIVENVLALSQADEDIDYDDRKKMIGPISYVMRNSQKYWMLEYMRRLRDRDPGLELDALVLGCVNPAKRQYALYLSDLGLEWRYSSPVSLQAGIKFKVRIGNIVPLNGQLTLVRAHA